MARPPISRPVGPESRRAALPIGWGVRTDASEARDSLLLAEWRTRWAEGRGELAGRLIRIEQCLDTLSASVPPPRLTIFAPIDDAMTAAG